MFSLKILLITFPFLLHAASAKWYVDFYEKGCEGKGDPTTGVVTIAENDGESVTACVSGQAWVEDEPFSGEGRSVDPRSVSVNGVSGTNWVVDLYGTASCAKDSLITSITEDDCFTSSTGDPLTGAIVRKA
ncbi:MAG: hypothetical protein Q9219_005726 [cf. Caloplaca sp. 3 TL-2023]